MERVQMTPKGERHWQKLTTTSGTMFVPSRTSAAVQDALRLDLDLSRLPVLGVGNRGRELSATVYKCGVFALRVIPNTEDGTHGIQQGVEWLKANLILEEALKAFSTAQNRAKIASILPGGIMTPQYFGMLATDTDCRYLMSDCSEGRKIPTERNEPIAMFVNGYCRKAVEETYGSNLGIEFDGAKDNILLGRGDAVKLDVFPSGKLISV